MSNELDPKPEPSQTMTYQIRIIGHLDSRWADWFGGMTITLEDNGDTLLTGPVIDQAALYGLLKKIRDLGMPLVSLNRIESGQVDLKIGVELMNKAKSLSSLGTVRTFFKVGT